MTDSIFSADYAERRAQVPRGLPMVVAMRGMSDAGGAIAQLQDYVWEHYSPLELVRFNTDLLLDYRSRRPSITFSEDHFVDYAPDELTLCLAHDELGSPFLLLSGFEPDFRWDQFVDTVLLLVHEFEVSTTVWGHALPMPVPHTRPITTTVSGSREDLIESRSVWKPTTRLSASAAHLLEYRLHGIGEDVAGFALLVPHYLAGTDYPDTLHTILDCIMDATGLIFSTDQVRDRAQQFVEQVNAQVEANDESREMVRSLESRYDSYMAAQENEEQTASPLVGEDGSIPTADQLASELERFLAEHHSDPDSPAASEE